MLVSPYETVFHGLGLHDGGKFPNSEILRLDKLTKICVDLLELLAGKIQLILCVGDGFRFLSESIYHFVEFGEDVLFVQLLGFTVLVPEDLLQLRGSDLSTSVLVQVLENSEQLILADVSDQIVNISQVQIASAFDIDQREELVDLGVAEFVAGDGVFESGKVVDEGAEGFQAVFHYGMLLK